MTISLFTWTFVTRYFCFSCKGIEQDPLVFSKLKGDVLFFTAGDKWCKVKCLGENGRRTIFFKTLIFISRINKNQSNYQIITSDRSSHGTTRSHSVATFAIKNHFKLIHDDMKGVSAWPYSTNYSQRLTLESWSTNLHVQQTPLNRCQQVLMPYKQRTHDKN